MAKHSLENVDASDAGLTYALVGDFDKAVTWLERAYDRKEPDWFAAPYYKIVPPAFFKLPRWKALTERPLYQDWQAAHDRVAAELAAGK